MNLYDKYEQKANRASFLITLLVLIVLLSVFEFNTSVEVEAEDEPQASYVVTVMEPTAILEEPKAVEELKPVERVKSEKAPIKDDFQSEEKIETKAKEEKKVEKKTEKKVEKKVKPKTEKKIVKKKEKTDKNEPKLTKNTENLAKQGENLNSTNNSENESKAKIAYEREQAKISYKNAFNSLLAFLSSKKQYPLKAKKLNQEGSCVIVFSVDKSGKVVSAKLTKSSDFPLLDRECNSLASKTVGFDSKVTGKELNVSVPVNFSLTSR